MGQDNDFIQSIGAKPYGASGPAGNDVSRETPEETPAIDPQRPGQIENLFNYEPGVEIEEESDLKKRAIARREHASQEIGDFLHWLTHTVGARICLWSGEDGEGALAPVYRDVNFWLHRYFGIDKQAAEKELLNALEKQRELNQSDA
jgi:hypothetical protein